MLSAINIFKSISNSICKHICILLHTEKLFKQKYIIFFVPISIKIFQTRFTRSYSNATPMVKMYIDGQFVGKYYYKYLNSLYSYQLNIFCISLAYIIKTEKIRSCEKFIFKYC